MNRRAAAAAAAGNNQIGIDAFCFASGPAAITLVAGEGVADGLRVADGWGGADFFAATGEVFGFGVGVTVGFGGTFEGGGGLLDEMPFTAPEFDEIISDDSSTASNARAGTVLSSSSIDVFHPFSALPWKYQFEPLSATISPYFFIARKTVCVSGRKCEMS